MYNFFVSKDKMQKNEFVIDGKDYNHIKNVLRMQIGDNFLVSCEGISYICRLRDFTCDSVNAEIIENYKDTELPIKIYLFQGLPKSDKMESIIQKVTELGAFSLIPTKMNRCVVKLDDKKAMQKVARWQCVSESAAKQSKRNIIPQIHNVLSFNDALKMASQLDLFLVPYESKSGMKDTQKAISQIKKGMSIGILIGPEGGFEESEIDLAKKSGAQIISLGSRILRTETAAYTSVAMCMLYSEMNINGDTE